MNLIDGGSAVAGIFGADFVFDAIGAYYAYENKRYVEAAFYSAAIAIPLMNGATRKALMDGSAYLLKTLNGKYVVVPRNVLGMNYMFRVEQAFSQFSRTALNVKSFNRAARYKTNKQFISALEEGLLARADNIKRINDNPAFVDGFYNYHTVGKGSLDNFLQESDEVIKIFSNFKRLKDLPDNVLAKVKNWDDDVLKQLDDDLADQVFRESFGEELVEAWKAVSKHPNISKHIPSLEKVSDLLNDADFMGKLPNGRADLDGIIDAVKNPLDGGGAHKLVKLADHLENVKQVVKKHSGAEGFDKLMTDLKNTAFAMQDGATHMLNDVKNFASGKVKKFDYEFDGDGVVCTKCRFDVELSSEKPRLIEYKSWSLENIPNISSKQLTEYFRSATSIGDIKYVFNKLKTPDVNSVKTQMKSVLSDNMEDIFEAMPSNFRENLLGAGKGDRLDLFEDLIDDTSSKLYDFIEVK